MRISRSLRPSFGVLLVGILLVQGLTWSATRTVADEPNSARPLVQDNGLPIELLAGSFVPDPGLDPALQSPASARPH